MASDIPSISSIVEVADITTSRYEWNVLVSPYSKILKNFTSIGTLIDLKDVQFKKGCLASLNHSLSLSLNVQSRNAGVIFSLDSNNKLLPCDFLAVEGNIVKSTVPFNFTRGPCDVKTDRYQWTASVAIAGWDESVDTLRFVLNIEHHPRHFVANFQEVPFTDGVELQADRFFLSKDFSDIIFVCNDVKFNAHRYALACKSAVFEKMFLTNMKEKMEGCVEIKDMDMKEKMEGCVEIKDMDMKEKMEGCVEIKDMDIKIFKEFLNFFYSGKIDETKFEFVIPLLAAADKYDVHQLKELCVNFLLRNLNPENALEIYSAAEKHNASILKIMATNVIKRNKHLSVADENALQYYINKHPDLMFQLFKM